MYISGSDHHIFGQVGIGTTDPESLVDITYGSGLPTVMGSSGMGLMLDRSNDASSHAWGSVIGLRAYQGSGSLIAGGATGISLLQWDTSALSTLMTVSSSGYVGIGITNPSTLFHTKTTSTTTNRLSVESNAEFVQIWVEDADSQGIMWRDGSNLYFGQASGLNGSGWDSYVTIEDGGNVGIGTTNPGYLQHLYSTTNVGMMIESTLDNRYAVVFHKKAGTLLWSTGVDSVTTNYQIYDETITTPIISIPTGSGNVGIGTTNPSKSLHVYHATNDEQAIFESGDTFASIGIKDPNDEAFVIQSDSLMQLGFGYGVLESNVSINTSGHIGIGTTNPSSPLHIYELYGTGDATLREQITIERFSNTSLQPGGGGSILFKNRDYAAGTTKEVGEIGVINTNGATGNVDPAMIFLVGEGTPTEKVRIDIDGNVGIGTTDISGKLAVYETANLPIIRAANDTNAQEAYIRIQAKKTDGTKRYADIGLDADTGLLFFDNNYTNRRMVINQSGYVGIGTTDPTYLLDVEGSNGYLASFISTTDFGSIIIADNDTTSYFISKDSVTSLGQASSVATTNLNILSSGYVGIGTSNPGAPIHVSGDGTTTSHTALFIRNLAAASTNEAVVKIHQQNSGDDQAAFRIDQVGTGDIMQLQDGGTSVVVVDDTGRVGIGTTNPKSHLTIGDTSSPTITFERNAVSLPNGIINFQGLSGASTVYGSRIQVYDGEYRFSTQTPSTTDNLTQVFTITKGGNVGIGTTNPATTLDVRGTGMVSSNDDAFLYLKSNADNAGAEESAIFFNDYTADKWKLYKATDHSFALHSYGAAAVAMTFHPSNLGVTFAGAVTASAGLDLTGDLLVTGNIRATGYKAFFIDNPQTGGKLTHMALEGPEPDVYFRGYSTSSIIDLPDYWEWLVDEETITVQLTPRDFHQQLLYIRDGYTIGVERKGWSNKLSYDYIAHGRRKDIKWLND